MLCMVNLAAVLDLPDHPALHSPIELADRIDDGLPVHSLERIAHVVAPEDSQFKYRLVPRATYERRKTTGILSSEEGTKVTRLARVWSVALDAWGSDGEARGFLFRPHAMLGDKKPVDVILQSEFGAEAVIDILGGLKYGTAA